MTNDDDLTISASVTITDAAGNTETITDTQTYTYNTTQPELWTSPASARTRARPATSRPATTNSPSSARRTPSSPSKSPGAAAADWSGKALPTNTGSWSVDTTVLPTGNWFFIAIATDEVGNRNFDKIDVEIISALGRAAGSD